MASRSPSSPTSADATISGWYRPPADGRPNSPSASSARSQPAWSPDGNWIAYASDYDGNEQWDIFLVSPKGGDVVNLTTTKEISEESAGLVARQQADRLHREAKDRLELRIELMDVSTRHVRHLTQNTPKDRSNFSPDFFARRQVRRLHPGQRRCQRRRHLRARSRHRQEHQAHAS